MKAFIQMSRYAGMREDLVQAGGGNTSVKVSDDVMLIKASGTGLSDMSVNTGYAKVDLSYIKKALSSGVGESEIIKNCVIEGGRPSIETFLHAFTNKYTLHVHPMCVNILTARKDGFSDLKAIFPDALLVPYATPGIKLFDALRNAGDPESHEIIFLKNHGLIVSASTAEKTIEICEKVSDDICGYLKINNSANKNVTKLYERLEGVVDMSEKVVCLSNHRDVYAAFESLGVFEHAFCPDCLVYLGKTIFSLRSGGTEERQIRDFCEADGTPSVIFYEKNVYIIADSIKKAKESESVLSFSGLVCLNNSNYAMDYLPESEQKFLLNWDSEKYRKQLK